MNKDLISGIGLCLLALAYFAASRTIAVSTLEDDFGPHGLPNILAIALGLTGVLLAVRGYLAKPRLQSVAESAAPSPHGKPLRAVGLLAIGFAYVLIVDKLGYAVSIALLIAGVAWYEGLRLTLRLAAVAVGGAALFWLIFVRLLEVAQPTGLLF
ncbi:MAG: tripartite tricarboxylate transporter TctB family protein [Steroidobacteraceae bacterium]